MAQTRLTVATLIPSDSKLINGFLWDCKLRGLTVETIGGYRSSLQIVSNLLRREGLSISRLDKDSLKEVLQHLVEQGYIYNMLVQYFAALSGFCDYLVWEGVAQMNPVGPFRKRYVKQYKNKYIPERKLISVEEMAMLINSVLDPRDKAEDQLTRA